MELKRAGLFLFLMLLGLCAGFFGTWLTIAKRNPASDMIQVEKWYTPLNPGSPESSAWDKTFIAYHATFALQTNEVIYLSRKRDESGEILRGNCSYEVTGGELPAHWWSLTLYDDQGYFARNDLPHSIDSMGVVRASEGTWKIKISPRKSDVSNWLPSLNAGEFNLLLRLYVPGISVAELKNLPVIRRTECRE